VDLTHIAAVRPLRSGAYGDGTFTPVMVYRAPWAAFAASQHGRDFPG
jgi:hypothetical protein